MFCRLGQMDNTSTDKTAKCKQINSQADKTQAVNNWIWLNGQVARAEKVEGRTDMVRKIWTTEEGLAVSRDGKLSNKPLTAGCKTTGWKYEKRGEQWWRTRGHNCFSLYQVGLNLLISHLTSMSTLSSVAPLFYKSYFIKQYIPILALYVLYLTEGRYSILCFFFPICRAQFQYTRVLVHTRVREWKRAPSDRCNKCREPLALTSQ